MIANIGFMINKKLESALLLKNKFQKGETITQNDRNGYIENDSSQLLKENDIPKQLKKDSTIILSK